MVNLRVSPTLTVCLLGLILKMVLGFLEILEVGMIESCGTTGAWLEVIGLGRKRIETTITIRIKQDITVWGKRTQIKPHCRGMIKNLP